MVPACFRGPSPLPNSLTIRLESNTTACTIDTRGPSTCFAMCFAENRPQRIGYAGINADNCAVGGLCGPLVAFGGLARRAGPNPKAVREQMRHREAQVTPWFTVRQLATHPLKPSRRGGSYSDQRQNSSPKLKVRGEENQTLAERCEK